MGQEKGSWSNLPSEEAPTVLDIPWQNRTPEQREEAKRLKELAAQHRLQYPTPAEEMLLRLVEDPRIKDMNLTWEREFYCGGYYIDLYCAKLQIGIEADGNIHDKTYDSNRDFHLKKLGIRILRLTNVQILQSPKWAANRIRIELETFGDELKPKYSPNMNKYEKMAENAYVKAQSKRLKRIEEEAKHIATFRALKEARRALQGIPRKLRMRLEKEEEERRIAEGRFE